MASVKQLRAALPGFFTVAEVQDLPEGNTFTIASAEIKKVGQGTQAEDKPILTFAESNKALVLNKSRVEQLSTLFGDDEVAGRKISLGVETIRGTAQIVIMAAE